MGALGHEQNPPQLGGFPLQEHGSPACSWLPRKIEQELLLDYFSLILVPEDPHISPYDLQTRRQQMPDLIIHIRMPAEADLLKPCRKMIFFFFQYTHNQPWPWARLFKLSSFYDGKVHIDIKVTRRE